MKAILVDDEPLALEYLERQINKVGNTDIVGKFTNLNIGEESNLIEGIDAVFLDIEMPGINGMELAKQLLEINSNLSIIFVTAYKEYAVNAFDLNALDYILKPVQPDRLKLTLERIEDNHKNQLLPPDHDKLQIKVCSELTFQYTKGTMESVQWRTLKARELFLYLLHHSGKTIHKSELIEILWAEFDPSKAYSQLYNAIYHVRKTLSKFSKHFLLKSGPDGYVLSLQNASIDIKEWESRMVAAPPLSEKTADDYEAIMDLYTGPYLQAYDYLWAESERYRLEMLWTNVAYQLGNYYYEQEEFKNARIWFVKICSAKPEEEDAHFSLMKLFAKLGNNKLVEYEYNQLTNALEELSIQVSPHIHQWYNQYKQYNN